MQNALLDHDNRYMAMEKEIRDLEKQFLKDASKEMVHLFMEHEIQVNSQNNIMLEAAYLQGFKDGMRFYS